MRNINHLIFLLEQALEREESDECPYVFILEALEVARELKEQNDLYPSEEAEEAVD